MDQNTTPTQTRIPPPTREDWAEIDAALAATVIAVESDRAAAWLDSIRIAVAARVFGLPLPNAIERIQLSNTIFAAQAKEGA